MENHPYADVSQLFQTVYPSADLPWSQDSRRIVPLASTIHMPRCDSVWNYGYTRQKDRLTQKASETESETESTFALLSNNKWTIELDADSNPFTQEITLQTPAVTSTSDNQA